MKSQFLRQQGGRRMQRGFTLIELLITMVIVGILTAIAVPSYGAYVLRTARADARASVLQATQFMERFYAVNSAYDQMRDGTPVQLPTALAESPANGTIRYNISLTAGNLTPSSYSIQAAPTGPSVTDECGTLTLSSIGVRGATGLPTAAGIAKCWR